MSATTNGQWHCSAGHRRPPPVEGETLKPCGCPEEYPFTPSLPPGQLWAVQVQRGMVWLSVGVQHFRIQYGAETDEDLEWMASQVRGAVEKLVRWECADRPPLDKL